MNAHSNQTASPACGTSESAKAVIFKLLHYCESRDWAGIDPYDALNSRIVEALPILDWRIPRLILSQVLKRSVVNPRPLLRVRPAQNPKAAALFLMSLLKLTEQGLVEGEPQIQALINVLVQRRSSNNDDWCWGYSFPWQTRTLLVPRWAPNLVCTTFVANALLDAYEHSRNEKLVEMAASSARYIIRELYWTDGKDVAGFAYPLPSMRTNVHNANFLAAAMFCRVAKYTADRSFLEPALKVARFSTSRQRPDGSWPYGESPAQNWIDNFHTGYNLCALREIGTYLETTEFEQPVRLGFEFYKNHFFREDGAARYFHDGTYPIDIHCVAQSMITLVALKDLDAGNISLAHKVYQWAIDHMWDQEGFFYYRVLRAWTNRISYMRWSQAWMLLAMTRLLCETQKPVEHPRPAVAVQS